MLKLSVLVVDDDPLARKVIAAHLKDHEVEFAHDFAGASQKFKDGSPAGSPCGSGGSYDVCFIDLKLGESDACSGLELIPMAVSKGIYSVVMSGHDTEAMVEKAYQLGCDDFYAKGNEGANISQILSRYLQRREQS